MIKNIIKCVLLLLISKLSFAQSFDAKVNRNTIPEGETFVLTLELKDVDTTASPDLNLLNDSRFALSVLSNDDVAIDPDDTNK